MPDNIVEELTSIAVLHDHVELLFGLDDFIELNDVWMPDLFQDFDFSRNPLHILLIVNFIFFEDFDGNLSTIYQKIALTFSPVRVCCPSFT